MPEVIHITGIVILAAGESARMGQPKQLLPYNGRSLLRHATETALDVANSAVVVVLGAFADQIEPELAGLSITIAHNADWSTGMGGSLRCGLQELLRIEPGCDRVLFMLCDQPHLSTAHLELLIQSGNGQLERIVASEYSGDPGVPALCGKSYFSELLALDGSGGAKQLFKAHREHVVTVPFPDGDIDIDTLQDFAKLSI
ncbi:MAG: nucleotidyltransferase family protein [Chthonomonadales bacterium]